MAHGFTWTYRVAVGDAAGPQSSCWRFWVWNNDVYVAARSIGHQMKVSLHGSDVWQAGLTSEFAKQRGIDPTARSWERWHRPSEFAPGVVKAFKVIVPASEVTAPLSSRAAGAGNVHWLPCPAEGHCTYITLLHSRGSVPQDTTFSEGNIPTRSLDHVTLPGGDQIWLVAHEELMNQHQAQQLRVLKAQTDPAVARLADRLSQTKQPRWVFFGMAEDGSRFFLDVAVEVSV